MNTSDDEVVSNINLTEGDGTVIVSLISISSVTKNGQIFMDLQVIRISSIKCLFRYFTGLFIDL